MVETTEIMFGFFSFPVSQMMAITGGSVETLKEIPAHVWKGLPDCLSLGPSAVNQSRVGESEGSVWLYISAVVILKNQTGYYYLTVKIRTRLNSCSVRGQFFLPQHTQL